MSYEVHELYDKIKLANTIMVDTARNKGKQSLNYKLEKHKRAGTFDIMNNTSKHVTLV